MPVRALWNFRKLFTTPYVAGNIPIELTKYSQTDYINRIFVRVFGSVNTGAGGAGTASGKDNPEGLLVSAMLQTQPTVAGVIPINQVSGRGARWGAALNRGFLVNPAAIADNGGATAIDFTYEFVFKRNGARKAIEYGFDISKYTSALLTLNFGDQSQLFTGSPNIWNFAGVNVEVWIDSGFAVNSDQNHAHEFFEQTFAINATQSDFPINQLPPGFLYTDLVFLAELDNALSNNILNNINIEGGGRIWTPAGDNNASQIQRCETVNEFDGSVGLANLVGVYAPAVLKSGMFSRAIDAIRDPIVIKLNVTFNGGHTNLIRMIGRRMLPGAVSKKGTATAK